MLWNENVHGRLGLLMNDNKTSREANTAEKCGLQCGLNPIVD